MGALRYFSRSWSPHFRMSYALVPYRPYSDPEKAARKILEIANSVEAMQEGDLHRVDQRAIPVPRERHAGRIQGCLGSRDRARLAGVGRERNLREIQGRWRRSICFRGCRAAGSDYLIAMPFEPCIPTKATKVPDRPEWIHEVKHDGYRLIVQREGKRVRLLPAMLHCDRGRPSKFLS